MTEQTLSYTREERNRIIAECDALTAEARAAAAHPGLSTSLAFGVPRHEYPYYRLAISLRINRRQCFVFDVSGYSPMQAQVRGSIIGSILLDWLAGKGATCTGDLIQLAEEFQFGPVDAEWVEGRPQFVNATKH